MEQSPSPVAAAPAATFRTTSAWVVPPRGQVEVPVLVHGLRREPSWLEVSVHVRHLSVGTLTIGLVSPDDHAVLLARRSGHPATTFGESCHRPAVFADDAPHTIGELPPPYVGRFRPLGPLAPIAARPLAALNGVWRLFVSDVGSHQTGAVLACATLAFGR
jgi:hypothetical protein